MRFWKLEGCGNDYVYIDARQALPDDLPALARRLSLRRHGVGADGLIAVCSGEAAPLRMRMFNADGSEAEMCGNGVRGFAKLAFDQGWSVGSSFEVETLAGPVFVEVRGPVGLPVSQVQVGMGRPRLLRAEIPMLGPTGQVVDEPLEVAGRDLCLTAVSMGNPHAVLFFSSVDDALVQAVGPSLENDPRFPRRVNVGFAVRQTAEHLRLRVWERGSGETLACGTGACAAWVAGRLQGLLAEEGQVEFLGGTVGVRWGGGTQPVFLTGPSRLVFEGRLP